MLEAAVQGALLTTLIFGSLLACHWHAAYRWWKSFGDAIRDDR